MKGRYGDWGRDLAPYLGKRAGGMKLRLLGEEAGEADYAAVSAAIKRFEKRLRKDAKLARLAQKALKQLSNVESRNSTPIPFRPVMKMKLILFILFGLVFLGCAAANAKVLAAFLTGRQTGSMIPLLGGLTGVCAAIIAPWNSIHQLWWAAPLLDAGTIYWLVSFFVPRR